MGQVWMFFLLYCFVHFGLYALIFRHWPSFSTEKVVFIYHVGSFMLSLGVLAVALRFLDVGSAGAIYAGCFGIHFIYSLTFLETWALVDGGYRLMILEHLDRDSDGPKLIMTMEKLGEIKKQQRLASLFRLGLVQRVDTRIEVTPRGRMIARALNLLLWPCGQTEAKP